MGPPGRDGDRTASLVLFDGVCALCSGWVRFVLPRDREHQWRFVAVQTPAGRALCSTHGIDPDAPPTMIVIRAGRGSYRSEAAIAVLESLPGWEWARHLRIVPMALRDFFYDRIALNRYRLFGRNDACFVPAQEDRGRFIEQVEDLP